MESRVYSSHVQSPLSISHALDHNFLRGIDYYERQGSLWFRYYRIRSLVFCSNVLQNQAQVRTLFPYSSFFHSPYIRDTFCNETSALITKTSNSRACLWPNDFLAVLLRSGKHVVFQNFTRQSFVTSKNNRDMINSKPHCTNLLSNA